ncbi:Hypothetical protein FKW44_022078, partial [Caligus rogercresseyi]
KMGLYTHRRWVLWFSQDNYNTVRLQTAANEPSNSVYYNFSLLQLVRSAVRLETRRSFGSNSLKIS